ncbi:orotidine 5'-phosphate decarboxylase [Nakamurella flavida]|uniref:Orotidine 5'-phosphate decarboxylase n=1 Tax=Nakamurella flavida TaxID=363630 RepID=A0A938YKL6_9ACTN|nr:orotidine 5'-phosphate decarboxylase / HUMPS family protein [Nakamurella flavida]MBM9475167.1 orotidine 5'-phosphate decarboxylase [Nakamurella flavida]MDP9776740.1 3-hexulose-6-phosphate synthase [Nakamurella flavida]
MSVRLQVALDSPAGFAVLPAIAPFLDIVEVGTPLLKRFGLAAITTVATLAPGVPVLADSKTVDGAADECAMLFDAGAAFVTVLSTAGPDTLVAAGRAARARGRAIVLDTILEADPLAALGRGYPDGITALALHTATDARLAGRDGGAGGWADAGRLASPLDLVVAGGIGPDTVGAALAAGPAVVVVGQAIIGAVDPVAAARDLRAALT